jgi:hypothetical protein
MRVISTGAIVRKRAVACPDGTILRKAATGLNPF